MASPGLTPELQSQATNTELLHSLYAAFAERDVAKIMWLVAPDIEVVQTELLPWGGEYQGIQGLGEFFRRLLQHIDSRVEIERVIEAGDRAVAMGRTQGRVQHSGKLFSIAVVHVWTIRDGKAARLEAYIDTPGMLEALAA